MLVYSMNSHRASRCRQFSSEMVCAVVGASWVTSAGGQGGTMKATFWTLRAVYASAVIVRIRWPLVPSPLSVCTEAAFSSVLVGLFVGWRKTDPCCCCRVGLGRGLDTVV
jgi:hypothetical protein